jgi:hypothetical protein
MAASNSYRIRRTNIDPYGLYLYRRVVETIAMTLRPVAFRSLEILAGGLVMMIRDLENDQLEWPEGWGSWERSMVPKSRSSCLRVCIEDSGWLPSHGRDRWE